MESSLDLSRWAEVCDGWQVLDRPDLAVSVVTLPGRQGVRPPFERRPQQRIHVLRGEVHVEIDGRLLVLYRGNGLLVPAGRPHRLWNDAADEARLLVVSTPASRDAWDLRVSPTLAER
jgi:quercetin dioxygenase-like cupin family protein